MADCAVNPLCRGIYAGDSAKLSVKSCFRPLFDLEAKFGSVMLGSLLSKKSMLGVRGVLNFDIKTINILIFNY